MSWQEVADAVSIPGRPSIAGGWYGAEGERIGASCGLVLLEPDMVAGGMRLAGTVRNFDDEWVLMECPAKKGGFELKVLHISHVESVESA